MQGEVEDPLRLAGGHFRPMRGSLRLAGALHQTSGGHLKLMGSTEAGGEAPRLSTKWFHESGTELASNLCIPLPMPLANGQGDFVA